MKGPDQKATSKPGKREANKLDKLEMKRSTLRGRDLKY
jgi:hypothetical protein